MYLFISMFLFQPGKHPGQTQQRNISQHAPVLLLKIMETIMMMKLFETVNQKKHERNTASKVAFCKS